VARSQLAATRAVPLPGLAHGDVSDHLAAFTGDNDTALVFTSTEGALLRHSNFYRRAWRPAVTKAGISGIRFHDLRHAGNAYTANAGANLRELMDRMGHSTTRAALIYLHSTGERQRALADAVDQAARAELRQARKAARRKQGRSAGASGTGMARKDGSGS
jgi:integrase